MSSSFIRDTADWQLIYVRGLFVSATQSCSLHEEVHYTTERKHKAIQCALSSAAKCYALNTKSWAGMKNKCFSLQKNKTFYGYLKDLDWNSSSVAFCFPNSKLKNTINAACRCVLLYYTSSSLCRSSLGEVCRGGRSKVRLRFIAAGKPPSTAPQDTKIKWRIIVI